MNADIAVIDAHVHVWDPRVLSYSWLNDTPIHRPMLPDEYDRGGVAAAGAIFVEATDGTVEPVAEARWISSLHWPELIAIVSAADLTAPLPELRRQLDALAALPRVAGVRHLLQDLPVDQFPRLLPGLTELAARGGTFDACIRHAQLPALIDLIRDVPELTVVLDHLGKPPIDEGIGSAAGTAWAEQLERLSARAQTFVKLSGLTGESQDLDAFQRHADAFLRHALDVFGPARAMVASDWPVSTTFGVGGSFQTWIGRVRPLVPKDGWPAVAGGTALRAYLRDGAPRLAANAA